MLLLPQPSQFPLIEHATLPCFGIYIQFPPGLVLCKILCNNDNQYFLNMMFLYAEYMFRPFFNTWGKLVLGFVIFYLGSKLKAIALYTGIPLSSCEI